MTLLFLAILTQSGKTIIARATVSDAPAFAAIVHDAAVDKLNAGDKPTFPVAVTTT